MRVASHPAFWTAASSAPTATSTAVEWVSEAVTSAAPSPAVMASTTPVRVLARRAYGRPCPYSAQSEPAIV